MRKIVLSGKDQVKNKGTKESSERNITNTEEPKNVVSFTHYSLVLIYF